ncbi:cytochrome p450 [Moniliophthora roreri MCA 2997]|uniref:Cytochrome p450 n=1 Tax=Moniliophthora roreri (strain MCA 2997) TaxID=1381753 RepID=V2XJZ9_MONRO|nr:cytochrome p450 [Moniliophthora roreri MCA 2997]
MSIHLSPTTVALYGVVSYIVYVAVSILYRSFDAPLHYIPGPKPSSWLYGNIPDLVFTENYGDHEFRWQKTFGRTYKLKGCMGEDKLFTSDPAALKYIFKNNHIFTRGHYHQHLVWMLMGEWSLFRISHDVHRRIRAIANSAFSQTRLQGVFPIVRSISRKFTDKLDEKLDSTPSQDSVIDVYHLIQHATSDVVAEAMMGYHFNAVETDGGDEVSRIHQNIILISSSKTNTALLADSLFGFIPRLLLRASVNLPTATFAVLRRYRSVMSEWSGMLYKQKLDNLRLGLDKDVDLLSAFVEDNEAVQRDVKISPEEIKHQITSMLVAGQDTTGNTITFALLEFARHPEWQDKVRQEILQMEGDLSYSNLDKLVYLNAHIKETLRYHPALPNTERLAVEDTVLPLSTPVKTKDRSMITEIPVRKGQLVYGGLASYNRDPEIWGADAHTFDAYRWIDDRMNHVKETGTSFGPYANVSSFIGGPHVCLGWRLAISEMQVMLADLLSRFAFEAVEGVVVRPSVAVTMQPVSEKGLPHLPLRVKRLEH